MAKKQYRIINKGKGILNISETDLHKIQNTTVIGGTFDNQNGILRFTNNESEEFVVSGITFNGPEVDTFVNNGIFNSNNGTIVFNNNQGGEFTVSGITIPEILELEGYSESGTRAGGDLVTTMGDYDDSNNGSKIIVDDAEGSVNLDSDIIRLGKNISGTTTNLVYVNNINIGDTLDVIPNVNNLVLARNSDGTISEVNIDSYYEGTYEELKTLKDNNELIPYKKYVLTDYQHKYIINGSDSGDIRRVHKTIGVAGAYTQFGGGVSSSYASAGKTATVVSVPTGATVSVGDVFTVVEWFNGSYINFTPTSLRSSNNFGVELEFTQQRYSNIPSNAVINDSNGKPVMKPNGVLNTDVHDGGPYMDMTGAENPTPIVEGILLTAISVNQFSNESQSLTFKGDTLNYNFDDTTFYDDDGAAISGLTRPGLITFRSNDKLGIKVNKDWRNQRYRRYKVDADNWNNLLLLGDSAPLYTVGGRNQGKSINNSLNEGHKYLLRTPNATNFYIDFYSSGNTDVFLSGETTPLSRNIGIINSSDNGSVYNKDITLPLSGITNAIDFHIFPIQGYEPSSTVTKFEVNDLINTIFTTFNQVYGNSRSISVSSDTGYIGYSTFTTGCSIINSGTISSLSVIENVNIRNSNIFSKGFICNTGTFYNDGVISNFRISGQRDTVTNNNLTISTSKEVSISNTIIGGSRIDDIIMSNTIINRCLILGKQGQLISFNTIMYGTNINFDSILTSVKFDITNYNKQIPGKGKYGTKHNITQNITDKVIDNNVDSGVLVTRSTDANFITSITQIGTTQ